MKRVWGLGLCCGLAVALNRWPIHLFFHTELLLGGSLAVLALLIWGWPGLLVGLAAGLSGMRHAGDGVALVNGLAVLIWLEVFLERWNGGRRQRDNGRVVLAALAYWLLVGGVTKLIWYEQVLGLSSVLARAMAARLVLTGVLCAVLGNGIYLAWLLGRARRGRGVVSLRGVVSAVLTLLLAAPAVVLAKARAAEVHQQALLIQGTQMRQQAQLAAALDPFGRQQLLAQKPSLLLELRQPDGQRWQSDPALFARLDQTYEESATLQAWHAKREPRDAAAAGRPQLGLLVPRQEQVELLRHQAGYWQLVVADASGQQVRVLQASRPLLEQLDGRMQWNSFGRLVLLLVAGSVLSDRLALTLAGQIRRLSQGGSARTLQPSGLRELDGLVLWMSKREAQLNQAQDQLLQVLDNLPIPVACQRLVQPGTSTLNGKLILLNRQFVETFGYPAAELVTVADWAERAYPDPSYRQDLFARFDAALAASCRSTPLGANGQVDSFDVRIVCADGHVREAQVFAAICDDLLITTLVDLSEQLLVERQLAMTLQRQSQQEQQQRQQLERKLRSSLSAAAVVHEIKQPLSTMLLQCRLGLTLLQQQGFDAGFEVERTLQNLNDQADQVVEIMERMRMLLRNVETDHQAVDLSLTVESTLLFLRRELEQAGIEVSSEGLDQSCHVLGDAVQLQIAIVNVLRNSIEAMAERGGRRRLQVWLGRHADEAVVRVSDSGPGFAAEANALVLNSSKTQGSGIGLFVVRTTLDHHQGRLVIARSPELGGAAVELRLPRLPAEATAAADPGNGQ